MKRWYLINYGHSPSRWMAADARDAVRMFLVGGLLEARDIVSVTVELTGEVVPQETWR